MAFNINEYRELIHERISNLMRLRNKGEISQDVYAELYTIKACLRDLERMEQEKQRNEWHKGYVCAVANIIRTHEDKVVAKDVLNQSVSDIDKLVEIGVDEQDLGVIKILI